MLLEVSVERFIVDMDYGRMIAKSLILLHPKFISQTQVTLLLFKTFLLPEFDTALWVEIEIWFSKECFSKGGFFSERADAFVISSDRQT